MLVGIGHAMRAEPAVAEARGGQLSETQFGAETLFTFKNQFSQKTKTNTIKLNCQLIK